MKTSFFFALSIALLLTTSCTKESLFDLEVNPSLASYSEPSQTNASLFDTQIEPMSALETFTSTVRLQQTNSFILSATNEYKVHFSNNYDFTGVQLKPTQMLNFKNPQGTPVTLAFEVNSYADNITFFEATYALGGQDLTGWQLEEMQKIVVEDVVVN